MGTKANKYTDKDRPTGFYEVGDKGTRFWNAYTKKWSKSALGSTDAMLSKASGRDVTATTQKLKEGLKGVARTYRDAAGRQGQPRNKVQKDQARKEGTRATLNGKPVVWRDGKWVSASRTWSNAYGQKSDKPSSVDHSKKEKPNTGDKTPPAPQLSARQKELQSINKDKSLSNMDKWVKANRKMIESVGTKRQREMLADYKKRHNKPKSKADGKVGDFSSKRTGNIA